MIRGSHSVILPVAKFLSPVWKQHVEIVTVKGLTKTDAHARNMADT